MPTKMKRRGKKVTRATVCLDGKIVTTKQFDGWSRSVQDEARAWEIARREEIVKERKRLLTRGFTLADWMREYLDFSLENQAPKTYEEKFYVFERFVDDYGDEMRVDEISPELVKEYLIDQDLERSGNAANKDRKNLSAGWNWAKLHIKDWPINDCEDNPFLKIPRFKEIRKDRHIPSAEDFWKVVDYATGQDKIILIAAYHLAARRGELWRLEWKEDLSFSEKAVKLTTRKTDDGNWESKWLPFQENDMLHRALLWQWENVRTNAHDHIFWSTREDGSHYGKPYVARQHWMKELCTEAGVKPFGMHAIRHRRAIDLYKAGAELCEIQEVLRHHKPTTTQIYLRKLDLDLSDLPRVMEVTKPGTVVNFG